MIVTFLGTGTSQGVPVIACECDVCLSTDEKDKRLRSSILIEHNNSTIIIDTGPDFRTQMLRINQKKMDAILFTHGHKDHIAGLDDIRAFNYILKKPIDIYCETNTLETIQKEFSYIFSEFKYPGIPEINIHKINAKNTFQINSTEIIPIEVFHYKLSVLGFRIDDFTYITDANFISETEKQKIIGSKILVLNALRKEKHISHFTLNEAIALGNELKVEQIYFTHISHQLGLFKEISNELPKNMKLAYDGLKLNI